MAMERKAKAATESLVLLVVIALICVAVNALGAFGLYGRKDMTKVERYTLSQGSGRLLKSMKQTLTIDAYITRGLPKLDAFVRDLRDLLQELQERGRQQVRVQPHRGQGRREEEGGGREGRPQAALS